MGKIHLSSRIHLYITQPVYLSVYLSVYLLYTDTLNLDE